MRNIFAALFLVLLISNCDSADPENAFVGSWQTISLTITECLNPTDNANLTSFSSAPCTDTSPNGCIYQLFEFTESTYSSNSNANNDGNLIDLSASGTYSIDGNNAEFCENGQDFCREGQMIIQGNTLDLKDLASPNNACVTALQAAKR